jgi:hypothetical protein
MQDKVRVELLRQPDSSGPSGWMARIGDASFPISNVEMALLEDGEPIVMLSVPASSVVVNSDPSQAAPPALRPAAPGISPSSYWGRPVQDPREAIPGWTPETSLGEQVAVNAAAHRG